MPDPLSINDLRHAFFGGVGEEQATLQAFYDAGLSANDLLSGIGEGLATGEITQTFSTADATHAARTSSAVATTAAINVAPYGYSQAQADAIPAAINAVRADLADTAALLNYVIDRLQAAGHFAA